MNEKDLKRLSDDELILMRRKNDEGVKNVLLGVGRFKFEEIKIEVKNGFEIDKVLSKRGLITMQDATDNYEADLKAIVDKVKSDSYALVAMGAVIFTVFTLLVMGEFGGYYFKFAALIGIALTIAGIVKLVNLKKPD